MCLLFLALCGVLPVQSIGNIPPPANYTRQKAGLFGEYLRSLPLRSDRTVYLYNGKASTNQFMQYAVVDLPIGNKDLQQCADVAMRLRAEFLFSQGAFGKIAFPDNCSRWHRFTPPYTRIHLQQFLEEVFTVCNSHSLQTMLRQSKLSDMQIGDMFIHGGFPGHVAMIADIAVNAQGEKAFLLIQGYMPAQDIHVLRGQSGAWYFAKEGQLITPGYLFQTSELKAW
jgi:hypothetical protein